jgi:ligand-binding sensor domain-containing protein/signal transduction histidine kinase
MTIVTRAKTIFFILLGSLSLAVAAVPRDDSYFVRAWTAEDGLPENKVVGVAQTPDGYLWVATGGGLVRFDGARFQPFEAARTAGYVSSTTRLLYLNHAGCLWLAKEGSVMVGIDGTTVRALTPKDGLPYESQRSIAEEKDGSLWIAYSSRTVARYQNGHVDIFGAKDGLPINGVCFLCTDRNGQLWFSKNGRIGVFRGGRFITLLDLLPHLTRIAPARSDGVWICLDHRVMKFSEDGEAMTLTDLPVAQTGLEPTALLEDREGAVWVGTAADGLFRCDTNGAAAVETSYSSISSLTEDREGNLWVGTQGGGLNRLQRRMISLVGPGSGLPFEGVRSVCRDAAGTLWAVGQNGTLARSPAGEKWEVAALGKELADVHVTCVTADAKGAVWIGTERGALYQWQAGQLLNVHYAGGVRKGGVRSLLATAAGDLWLFADSLNNFNALYRIRNGSIRKFDLSPGYRFIRALAEDTAGNIWAGASDGLLLRVTGETLFDETPKFPKFSIRCLQTTPDGSLWIGYAGFGTGRLREGRLTRFSSEQGLPNDFISQILADGRGALWFASNQGVFSLREQEFDDVAAGRSARLQPVIYGRNKGMPNLQASFDYCPNAVRADDGRLFFSMLTGLAQVHPDRVRLNRLPPVVVVERVLADGQTLAAYQASGLPVETNTALPVELGSLDDTIEIHIPAGTQQVQFEFTALSFVTPENVQFRYQLEGLDHGWVDAGTRRVAQYTHPPPGSYLFKVIAANNDRVWNDTGVTLAVSMEPQIWETLWFKALMAVATFGTFSAALVWLLRRRHRLQIVRLEELQTLERERARIARDLHDDLGVGLTEIGLLGDLASAPAATLDTSRGFLHEITGRARELVVMLDEIVWAINPANDTAQSLSDYFFRYAQNLLQRAGIRCRLEVIEPFPNCGLNAEERHQLFLAFKEALNNVIRHSGATEVRVSLAVQEEHLMIRVTDNGHGPNQAKAEGSQDGLKGMQERLLRLGGRCDIAAVAEGGMSVKLLIPAGPKK